MYKKLELPDVTLVSYNMVAHELTALAIADCVSQVNFGDVKVFSDKKIWEDTIIIKSFTKEESLHFL